MAKIKWRVLDKTTYRQKVEKVIINHERDAPRVYLDYKGIPTVGPGKALVVYGVDKKTGKNKWVVAEGRPVEGVDMLETVRGSKLNDEQYGKLQTAADNLNKYGPGDKAYEANAVDYYNNPADKRQSARLDSANNKFGVELTPEQQEKFKDKVIDATEADFDRATTKSGKVRLDETVPLSEERIALVSIYHQQPRGIDDNMRTAINEGDRGGVIGAIEGSKAAEVYKTRRKAEADQFGRPNDPDVIRHENNSQADLDATFKKPTKVTPTEPFGPTMPQQDIPQQPYWKPIGPSEEVAPTAPRASILDSVGNVAGKIGGAISTVGHVTLDMATSLGKGTLNQMMQMALTGGANGKDVMKRAVQLAMGNMVVGMQAQMMAELQRQMATGVPTFSGTPPISNGTPPIIFPEEQRSVEDVMNSPRNQGLFEKIAEQLMALLGAGGVSDPSQVMVNTLVDETRHGNVYLPGDVLIPDWPSKERAEGPQVTILGIPVGISYPKVIYEENPGQHVQAGGLAVLRNGEGSVVVRAHTRAGHFVRGYTRTAPDADVTNNLSYRGK